MVEDSAPYACLIQRAFHSRGNISWKLTMAEDGARAVEFLFGGGKETAPLPDLILLDWHLPNVSGSEVLHRLKEHGELRKIPVLVFSSSHAALDIHGAYADHANGYLTKPDSVDGLSAIVEIIEKFWVGVAKLPKVARYKSKRRTQN